jgi:hypothetical protein
VSGYSEGQQAAKVGTLAATKVLGLLIDIIMNSIRHEFNDVL